MKTILLIGLLVLTGCYHPFFPNFEVGDCIALEDRESWEKDFTIEKVLAVGERKYRIMYVNGDLKGIESTHNYIRRVDLIMEKVECPKGEQNEKNPNNMSFDFDGVRL